MTEQKFYKLIDVKYQQYVDWGYDKFDVARETNMVNGTPDTYYKGGSDEKEAILYALDRLDMELTDLYSSIYV